VRLGSSDQVLPILLGEPLVWVEERDGIWFVGLRKLGDFAPHFMMTHLALDEAQRAEERWEMALAGQLRNAAERPRTKNAMQPGWRKGQ
jgi:hypothetical protein